MHGVMPARDSRQGPVRNGDLRTYCKSDIERLCPGIEPGGGRILKCLKANKMEMTVGCAQALKKLKSKMQ
jgi:hypothetical protein